MSDTVHLDARGLLCPMPVIRTQNAIKKLRTGNLLIVTCTDPGVLEDIPAWCRVHGHTVMESSQDGNDITITIQVQESN